MHAIKPANKELAWIISPYREMADKNSIRTWLDNKVKSYNAKYVCVSGNEVSFSLYEGLDFGRTLARIVNHDNFIYLEYRDERIIFIHIKGGRLVEDRVLSDADALSSALLFIADTNDNPQKSKYKINYFGLTDDVLNADISNLFKRVAGDESSQKEQTSSYFESIEISELSDEQLLYFVEFKNAVRDLADTKTQKLTLFTIVIMILIAWLINSDTLSLDDKEERINLTDNYKDYTQLVLNGSSFSVRLAQDFRIHKVINRELPNWKLYKVTHTDSAIEYRLLQQTHLATVSDLTLFSDNYGMALINDSNGIGVVASVDRQPVYSTESEVRRYPMDELTANILDIESNVTPFVNIRVKRTTENKVWSSREMNIILNSASSHDLLRLAAIVDGFPERYPAFFTTCQSQGCSYDVSPQGVLSGAINFTIYGISLGGNSNGE